MSSGLPFSGRNEQRDRIAAGGLASSTEKRLKELTRWGGFSSFFTSAGFAAGESGGVHPVGQVVGLASGELRHGYVRIDDRWRLPVVSATARLFNDEASELADARWQEHPQIVRDWDRLRGLALGRLIKQAQQLGCQAVVGVQSHRRLDWRSELGDGAVLEFTGTAVRIDGWGRRTAKPALTMASVNEVASMLARGIEPAGIVGGVGRIELQPSGRTVDASRRTGSRVASTELVDLTYAVYEVRRAALKTMYEETRRLGATGVLGVALELEREGAPTQRSAHVVVGAHALGSAVRRVGAAPGSAMSVHPVIDLAHRSDA